MKARLNPRVVGLGLALLQAAATGCGQAVMSSKLKDFDKAYETSLWIDTATLPVARVGVPYSATLVAHGEPRPHRWRLVSGRLPVGLSLDPLRGFIHGTPAAPGDAALVVEVSSQVPNTPDQDARKPYIPSRARRLMLAVAPPPAPAPIGGSPPATLPSPATPPAGAASRPVTATEPRPPTP